MKWVWAALWASAGREEWEAVGRLFQRFKEEGASLRVVLFHTGKAWLLEEAVAFFGSEVETAVFPVQVSPHPRASLAQQNPENPDYPETILAPYASASKRLEGILEAWQDESGPPWSLVVPSTDGLAYFAFHRAWRDAHYLRGTRLALLERPSRGARAAVAGEPLYRRDHYWSSRMEAFCAAAATIRYGDGGWGAVAMGDPLEREGVRRFPVAGKAGTDRWGALGGNGRLTVVIPYYNMGIWIGEAIDSVLQSERSADEVLIIDDGSDEEDSREALRIEAARSERIRVIRQKNRGLGPTRIRGVEEATGEFVFFLDADDAVTPSFFGKALSLLERFDNVTMVTAWEQYFGQTRKVWPKWDADIPWMLGQNMTTPMVMVRRSAWLGAVRWDSGFAENFEDYDAWLSLLENGGHLLCIPEVLLRHRIRVDSRWERRTPGQIQRLKAALVRKHPILYRRYAVELAGLLAANGPAAQWDTPGAFHDRPDTARRPEARLS